MLGAVVTPCASTSSIPSSTWHLWLNPRRRALWHGKAWDELIRQPELQIIGLVKEEEVGELVGKFDPVLSDQQRRDVLEHWREDQKRLEWQITGSAAGRENTRAFERKPAQSSRGNPS